MIFTIVSVLLHKVMTRASRWLERAILKHDIRCYGPQIAYERQLELADHMKWHIGQPLHALLMSENAKIADDFDQG